MPGGVFRLAEVDEADGTDGRTAVLGDGFIEGGDAGHDPTASLGGSRETLDGGRDRVRAAGLRYHEGGSLGAQQVGKATEGKNGAEKEFQGIQGLEETGELVVERPAAGLQVKMIWPPAAKS